jgi:hypothetical protein
MKVTCFTTNRGTISFAYPVFEASHSILLISDEFVAMVGKPICETHQQSPSFATRVMGLVLCSEKPEKIIFHLLKKF